LGGFEGIKYDSEANIAKKEKLRTQYTLSFMFVQMRYKAEIWHTYRRTTQTSGKNLKPGKFCPGGPKWGMENVVFLNILAPMARRET
jgi:hypothetical protein